MMASSNRTAIIGGDGRIRNGLADGSEVVVFKSRGDGGNGDARRLEAALRAGSFGTLIILTRWNSHSTTQKLRRLCKKLGVEVVMMR